MLRFTIVFSFLLAVPLFGADPLWNGYGKQNAGPRMSNGMETMTADSTVKRFYLLRTGFLLEGTAATEGRNYVLKTDFGTMHVPVVNVEYIGQDKPDIYRYKKSFVDGGNCNDLMKFAEWCLNIGLKQEGVTEYERALKVAPNSTLSDVIRKRLETIRQQDEAPEETLSAPLSGSAASPKSQTESEISRWGASVPKPVVDDYVRKVQPVLLSGCGAADCHGTNSSNKLKIAKPRQILGATSHGNLRAVLPWINLDYPTESPLLTALVNYHGGTKPPYTVESKQYDNVLQWIQLAAKELPIEFHQALSEQNPSKKDSKTEQAAVKSTAKNEPPVPKENSLLPPGFHNLAKTEKNADVAADTEENAETEESDPLDPAVFNARHHGAKIK